MSLRQSHSRKDPSINNILRTSCSRQKLHSASLVTTETDEREFHLVESQLEPETTPHSRTFLG